MEESPPTNEPEPDDDDAAQSGEIQGHEPAANEPAGRKVRRVPPPGQLEDKWFMVGWEREPALAVTIAHDQLWERGAGAGITGRILAAIDVLIKKFGGGVELILAGAFATESITVYLDDPLPRGDQSEIPVEFTMTAASRVQELMRLNGDELFTKAVELGPAARSYVEFVRQVGASGVSVQWRPRGQEAVALPPKRATGQYERLTATPELRELTMSLIGLLYRVIADPTQPESTLGIKLAKESPRPPGHNR